MEHTNLPAGHFLFGSQSEIYWRVRMVHYEVNRARLQVEVIDYQVDDTAGFDNQFPRRPVRYIRFETLKWQSLRPLLSYYSQKMFNDIIDEPVRESTLPEETPAFDDAREIQLAFNVSINDVRFDLGMVIFERYVEAVNQVLRQFW